MEVRSFPTRITIEMTNKCNLNCTMCPRLFMKDNMGIIDTKLWKRLLDEVKGHEVTIIPFWRGESTLHPTFMSMVSYARKRAKRIEIATNGIGSSRVAGTFLKAEFVSISCHTEHGLGFLRELWQAKQNFRTSMPVLQATVVEGEEFDDRIEMLAKKYADIIRIYERHSYLGNYGALQDRPKEERIFCNRLLNDMVIDCHGNVSRCCHNWNTDAPMNVRDSTIEEIWNGDSYKEIRDKYPDDICFKCDQWNGPTSGKTIKIDQNYNF